MTWAQGWIWQIDDSLWYGFLTGLSGLVVSTALVVWFRLLWQSAPSDDAPDEEAADG